MRDVEGLVNPKGFVITDDFQRNPEWPDIFGIGVCIAIPPWGKRPCQLAYPKQAS